MDNDLNAPATKADLKELEERFTERLNALEERSTERLRDMQTELLRAFYSFAQSVDTKLKETEIADIMLRQRLTAVESRVTEIEKRLNMPPAA